MSKFIILPFLILTLFVLSCKQNGSTAKVDDTTKAGQDTISNAGDTIKLPSLQDNNRGSLVDIIPLVGQSPSSVKLFDKMNIGPRIQKLMGSNYDSFIKNWNEDTPLQKDGDIVYTSACKTGDCNSNQYILIFDTKIQIINVYTFEGKRMRTFEEDNTITGLPYKCQDWFDAIMEKQMR